VFPEWFKYISIRQPAFTLDRNVNKFLLKNLKYDIPYTLKLWTVLQSNAGVSVPARQMITFTQLQIYDGFDATSKIVNKKGYKNKEKNPRETNLTTKKKPGLQRINNWFNK
jgi:hypothetical protein